ncbi:Ankyrin repeat domain-containing protein 17 [Metarhizium brunneum]|uniref:Ankyrin repeat domain-containing protein 17 n=1 Tax=Metarhizium brunneum TaxID=500148 RepID=A0A7D5Z151_9HYPO
MAHDSSQTEGYAKLLHDAVRQGDVESVGKLVCEYKRPNEPFEGRLPLVTAIRNKSHDVIKVLLEHGADVKLKGTSGRSPLGMAINMKDRILLETLLRYCGSLADHADEHEPEPLLWNALEARDEAMALMLIEHGADIKQRRNACEYSPLMVACHGRLPRAAQKLIEMGADVEDRSWDGMSPLMVASQRSDLATAKKLIDFGADLEAKKPAGGYTALYYAVWYRRPDMTELLVREGAQVNQPLAGGFTALSVAADNNSPEIARFLLANGADVNRATGSVTACIYADGLHVDDLPADALLTPLHLAAENGHADMARLLLDNGAQVNAASTRGYTPLMLAAHNGHADTVSILIRRGADISAHAADGSRALSIAALFYDGLLRREVKLGRPSTARPRASRFGFERDCEQPPRQYERVIALLAKAGYDSHMET